MVEVEEVVEVEEKVVERWVKRMMEARDGVVREPRGTKLREIR